jgi:hypothetical protein
MRNAIGLAAAVMAFAASSGARAEEAETPVEGYTDTPLLPGGKWHVHDPGRPQPPLVKPGEAGGPPADAVVLFDGRDLAAWVGDGGKPAEWKVENGYVEVKPGSGGIRTRATFGDCQLHIEWATPARVEGRGQGRGNSGVFFMDEYELQILDSFRNRTYPDGQAAAIYGQFPPLVNASRGPGEWQVYDAVFTAPRFEGKTLKSPARLTVLHNGVAVHANTELLGLTHHKAAPAYEPHGPEGRIRLQDHGNPMRFRNIWVRRIKGYDEP